MSWDDFVEKGAVRKVSIDTELAKSLVKMSASRIEFLKKQAIDAASASVIASEYYEAVREICEAIAASRGFKVYSHEALTLLIKEVLKEENASVTFDRYRKIRNGINYYGRQIGREEAVKAASEIKQLISRLKSKYL